MSEAKRRGGGSAAALGFGAGRPSEMRSSAASMTSLEKGFTRKSRAPRRNAVIAVACAGSPVITMVGGGDGLLPITGKSSIPSPSLRLTSRRTASNWADPSCSLPAATLSATAIS
jgi:hypothetical protein